MIPGMPASRPVVGLTTSEVRMPDPAEQIPHADAGRRELALGLTYMRALAAGGAAPVVLAPLDVAAIPSLLDAVTGLCVPGGPDVDPEHYGGPRHPKLGPTEPQLDVFEIEAVREAERRGMPILAICRGAQVLNVAHGGDLLQHLPDDVGEEVRHVRADPVGRVPEHEVEIEPDSLLARVTGRERMTVNSSHHQAPDRIGAGLRVVARAADGVVEGLERPDRDFVLGVQWHAEAIANRVEQAALFSAFVDAARRYAASTSSTARTASASQPA